MKKTLITILVVLILLLGGAWVYLLLNGAPKSLTDIRDNILGKKSAVLPVAGPSDEVTAPAEETPSSRTVATGALLVKLTDRRVAGAVIATLSAGKVVRYAEKGTGNIYDIALQGGVETRVSNKTIPRVVDATWSPSGERVVLMTDIDGTRGDMLLGTLGTDGLTTEPLPSVGNASFGADSTTLYYTEKNPSGGTTGFARNLRTGTIATLFTLPFSESVVLWDIWDGRTHYAYTKVADGFQGFLYRVTGGELEKIDEAVNLTASRMDADTLIINKNSGEGPYSLVLDMDAGTGVFTSIQTLTEKCAGQGETIWCGASEAAQSNDFPVSWYQGSRAYADNLYRLNRSSGSADVITNPETAARESIDITNLMLVEGQIIFRNKVNDSLWLYNPPSQ